VREGGQNEPSKAGVALDSGTVRMLGLPAMLTRRTPWVLVLAAVVLVGALDMHLADESHEFVGVGGNGTYSLSAKHPNAPAHYEKFEQGQEPDCPFCLHQLRISGAHLQRVAHLATPPLTGFSRLVSAPVQGERCAAPRGARGPPSV
jgi:hypothetical protein